MFRKTLALERDALRLTLGAIRTGADPQAAASPGQQTLRRPL